MAMWKRFFYIQKILVNDLGTIGQGLQQEGGRGGGGLG